MNRKWKLPFFFFRPKGNINLGDNHIKTIQISPLDTGTKIGAQLKTEMNSILKIVSWTCDSRRLAPEISEPFLTLVFGHQRASKGVKRMNDDRTSQKLSSN